MKNPTTIEPQFLWRVRKMLSAPDALNLLTLISVGPGQYKTKDLAIYCEAQRSNISSSLKRLHEAGWIQYCSLGKNGILLWFIKTDVHKLPAPDQRPAWVLLDRQPGLADAWTHVYVGESDVFAAIHGLNPRTVRNFLNGKPGATLAGRWSISTRLPWPQPTS
jgi:hypothetical protein